MCAAAAKVAILKLCCSNEARSSLFLPKYLWTILWEKWKLHWNFLCERKIHSTRKQTNLDVHRSVSFDFCQEKEVDPASLRIFFFLISCWRTSLRTFWSCISMKSELHTSASVKKAQTIKWASYKCDDKAYKVRNCIIMHHSAVSLFH